MKKRNFLETYTVCQCHPQWKRLQKHCCLLYHQRSLVPHLLRSKQRQRGSTIPQGQRPMSKEMLHCGIGHLSPLPSLQACQGGSDVYITSCNLQPLSCVDVPVCVCVCVCMCMHVYTVRELANGFICKEIRNAK